MSDWRDFHNFLQSLNEAAMNFSKQVAPVLDRVYWERQRIVESFRSCERNIKRFHEVAQSFAATMDALGQAIAPHLIEFALAVQELPDKTRNELSVLANKGWYVDPEMPCTAIGEIAELFLNGNEAEAHSRLEAYYIATCSIVEERLKVQFPARHQILSEAFEAHRNSKYSLSVPVFLAQADGICVDLLGVQLYSKRDGGTKTAVQDAISETVLGSNTWAYLSPLTKPFPISFGPAQRDEQDLNRHAVFHGESVNYNSMRNSCKAISLLAFTAWTLSDLNEEAQPNE